MANTKSTGLDAGNKAGVTVHLTKADTRPAFSDPQAQQKLAEGLKAQFRAKIRAEEKIPVTLAPSYRHPFGKVMVVRLNGYAIYVPCDGRTYMVPKSYAAIIHARRRAYDEQELRQDRMAQVTNNNEQYAGQLQFG